MIQCAVLFPFSRCENFEARGEGGKGGVGLCEAAVTLRARPPARPPALTPRRQGAGDGAGQAADNTARDHQRLQGEHARGPVRSRGRAHARTSATAWRACVFACASHARRHAECPGGLLPPPPSLPARACGRRRV